MTGVLDKYAYMHSIYRRICAQCPGRASPGAYHAVGWTGAWCPGGCPAVQPVPASAASRSAAEPPCPRPAHPASARSADRADAAAARLAQCRGHAGQASTGLIETWWVSRLGLDALAGVALVFPGVHDDADAVGRRDGRRHLVGGGARPGRRPPRRRRRAGAARDHRQRRDRRRVRRAGAAASARRCTGRSAAKAARSPPRSSTRISSSPARRWSG